MRMQELRSPIRKASGTPVMKKTLSLKMPRTGAKDKQARWKRTLLAPSPLVATVPKVDIVPDLSITGAPRRGMRLERTLLPRSPLVATVPKEDVVLDLPITGAPRRGMNLMRGVGPDLLAGVGIALTVAHQIAIIPLAAGPLGATLVLGRDLAHDLTDQGPGIEGTGHIPAPVVPLEALAATIGGEAGDPGGGPIHLRVAAHTGVGVCQVTRGPADLEDLAGHGPTGRGVQVGQEAVTGGHIVMVVLHPGHPVAQGPLTTHRPKCCILSSKLLN